MSLSTWRSTRKYPSNRLCTRGFARELKVALIGAIGEAPEYPQVERAFYERTGAELGRATWHGWWHGSRLPNATYRAIVDKAFPGLASKWLYRSLDQDRLQGHLSALDLVWIGAKHSIEESRAEAWEFLCAIHQDWAPHYHGEIFLPGPPAREGLGRTFRSQRSRPDPRAVIPIGRIKGPPSRLRALATSDAAMLHEPLDPSSILAFMFCYGVESGLPDPGLKEAFILDFLAAAVACLCLVQIIAPHRIHDWGRCGQIFFACQAFFWEEDYGQGDPLWILNEPFARGIAPLLDEMAIVHDYAETQALFHELKEMYYATLAITGLDTETLRSFVTDNLCTRALAGNDDQAQ